MSIKTPRGSIDIPVSVTPETYNLFTKTLGEGGEGLGVIDANVDGPLGSPPSDGNARGVWLLVDNRGGDADIYLAKPQLIPASDDETAPVKPVAIFPAGQLVEDGPFDLPTFGYVVRALAGAVGTVSVSHVGMGWRS